MQKLMSGGKRLLRQPGFHLFCALVFSGVFNWPVLSELLSFPPLATFFLIFGIWAFVIVLQFFICQALQEHEVGREGGEDC